MTSWSVVWLLNVPPHDGTSDVPRALPSVASSFRGVRCEFVPFISKRVLLFAHVQMT